MSTMKIKRAYKEAAGYTLSCTQCKTLVVSGSLCTTVEVDSQVHTNSVCLIKYRYCSAECARKHLIEGMQLAYNKRRLRNNDSRNTDTVNTDTLKSVSRNTVSRNTVYTILPGRYTVTYHSDCEECRCDIPKGAFLYVVSSSDKPQGYADSLCCSHKCATKCRNWLNDIEMRSRASGSACKAIGGGGGSSSAFPPLPPPPTSPNAQEMAPVEKVAVAYGSDLVGGAKDA